MVDRKRSFLSAIRSKFRHGLVLKYLGDRLEAKGVTIQPYYLCQEGPVGDKAVSRLPELDHDHELVHLGPEDMDELGKIEDRSVTAEQMRRRLEQGQTCLALKIDGQVAAFTWANLKQCPYPQGWEFDLAEDEAYLFDAYTSKAYRGRNLAASLRYYQYEELARAGRRRYYSVTLASNQPSLRFKKKVGARLIRLSLYVKLFNRWRGHWTLKNYARTGME